MSNCFSVSATDQSSISNYVEIDVPINGDASIGYLSSITEFETFVHEHDCF